MRNTLPVSIALVLVTLSLQGCVLTWEIEVGEQVVARQDKGPAMPPFLEVKVTAEGERIWLQLVEVRPTWERQQLTLDPSLSIKLGGFVSGWGLQQLARGHGRGMVAILCGWLVDFPAFFVSLFVTPVAALVDFSTQPEAGEKTVKIQLEVPQPGVRVTVNSRDQRLPLGGGVTDADGRVDLDPRLTVDLLDDSHLEVHVQGAEPQKFDHRLYPREVWKLQEGQLREAIVAGDRDRVSYIIGTNPPWLKRRRPDLMYLAKQHPEVADLLR